MSRFAGLRLRLCEPARSSPAGSPASAALVYHIAASPGLIVLFSDSAYRLIAAPETRLRRTLYRVPQIRSSQPGIAAGSPAPRGRYKRTRLFASQSRRKLCKRAGITRCHRLPVPLGILPQVAKRSHCGSIAQSPPLFHTTRRFIAIGADSASMLDHVSQAGTWLERCLDWRLAGTDARPRPYSGRRTCPRRKYRPSATIAPGSFFDQPRADTRGSPGRHPAGSRRRARSDARAPSSPSLRRTRLRGGPVKGGLRRYKKPRRQKQQGYRSHNFKSVSVGRTRPLIGLSSDT